MISNQKGLYCDLVEINNLPKKNSLEINILKEFEETEMEYRVIEKIISMVKKCQPESIIINVGDCNYFPDINCLESMMYKPLSNYGVKEVRIVYDSNPSNQAYYKELSNFLIPTLKNTGIKQTLFRKGTC